MSAISIKAATTILPDLGKPVPEPKVMELYESFGGFEAFTDPKITDEMKALRNALLAAPNLPSEVFKSILNNTKKVTRQEVTGWGFFSSVALFKDFSLFKRFWDINPNGMMLGLYFLEVHALVLSAEWNSGRLWEPIPMVHSKDCNGSPAHPDCKSKRFRPDALLDIKATVRNRLIETIDPRVIDLIQEQALTLSADSRVRYADSLFVHEDHWRLLATDSKREVINTLTTNSFLPAEIAKQIITTHKTALLRENIAHHTVDPEVLQIIWNSTKSESIHEEVSMNPFWSKPF